MASVASADRSEANARRVFHASLVYLPMLILLMLLDPTRLLSLMPF